MPSDETDKFRKLKLVGGGALLVVAIVVAWINLRPASNSVDAPDGTFWICKKCDNHFNMATRALNDFQAAHYGEPLPCPKCGSTELLHAVRCPQCGEYVAKGAGPPPDCPKCGHKFATATP